MPNADLTIQAEYLDRLPEEGAAPARGIDQHSFGVWPEHRQDEPREATTRSKIDERTPQVANQRTEVASVANMRRRLARADKASGLRRCDDLDKPFEALQRHDFVLSLPVRLDE